MNKRLDQRLLIVISCQMASSLKLIHGISFGLGSEFWGVSMLGSRQTNLILGMEGRRHRPRATPLKTGAEGARLPTDHLEDGRSVFWKF